MGSPIPYGRQSISDADVDAVAEALRDDFLTTGPRVAEFERAVAAATGTSHATAVSSGTAALHTAYAVLDVAPGDEVVVPALTFAATANAARYLGADVVFADVSSDGTVDPRSVVEAVTERTALVAAVDFAGLPADYPALRAGMDRAVRDARRPIALVADAAHSLGATLDGRPAASFADASALSFHPVKHITTGEGGAVVTDDGEVHRRAQAFRTHGIVREPERLARDEGPWYHEMQALGFNYRLTDVQSALGLSQLRRLEAFVARRRRIAAVYDARLCDVPGIELPARRAGADSSWHLYVLRVLEAARRRPFFDGLRAAGLGVQVHYIPVYWHPYYRDLGYREGLCPNAEDFYRRAVSIPIYPAMTDDDVDRVVATIRDVARDRL